MEHQDESNGNVAPLRAWEVVIRGAGIIHVIGDAQEDVVEQIQAATGQMIAEGGDFAKLSLVDGGGRSRTAWVRPAAIVAIFGLAPPASAGPPPPEGLMDFLASLETSKAGDQPAVGVVDKA
jgi:hypothetical protein